jgi:hypothetical protein
MSKNNIFDLSKIAAPSNDIESKPANDVDQESSLIGYELIIPTEWKYIPYGSYIRYLRKDGSFRKGGIVQGVWSNLDKSGNEVVKIDITAGFSSKVTKWSIVGSSIEKIWIKRMQQQSGVSNISGVSGVSDLTDIKEDIEHCKESIKQLTKEMQKMQNEQIRVIGVLKKILDSRRQ